MLKRGESLPGYGPYTYPEEEKEHRIAEAKRRWEREQRADYLYDQRRDDRLTGDR